ncbi:hypothetical protein PHYBLDRAFT_169264 [Phycomyces blakesleeanus NRRL 1555(-)]|uniref:Uncharacterized protein n=1 Tax=Phycomyces blakesleeanus (strain ATCC 8743b / DSM 1359 / FGSC 10004 / NBRC 33097 / NRRL 1555) TaxID=763407 RepID=A0A162PHX1_PHYB8|nr:hypothetical protein PHYBLDRAFT_169264 [Phycomyces blakesleeanus NRRL 1555(-)]OAD73007.1 hypothetical protein PHYBLDRAFT_169264 [Phycomyces blakesleeanus NRRL 1555(-)]|eukprot:XP_018291047.1 hypothetical protein PHYBLDRAFT_169264 [Phycomyces blakesleeanus NRRL 1555(-)]
MRNQAVLYIVYELFGYYTQYCVVVDKDKGALHQSQTYGTEEKILLKRLAHGPYLHNSAYFLLKKSIDMFLSLGWTASYFRDNVWSVLHSPFSNSKLRKHYKKVLNIIKSVNYQLGEK